MHELNGVVPTDPQQPKADVRLSIDQSIDLLDSISSAFYGLDEEWRFIYLNSAAEHMLGRKREDLLGKNIWEEFPTGVNTQSFIEMHRARKEQKVVWYETFSTFLNAWIEVELSPTRTGLSVYFHDITQRKLSEESLNNNQKRLYLLSDALPNLISYFDTQLHYQFVNRGYEKLFGLTREQIIGKHIVDVVGQEAFDTSKQDIEIALNGQPVYYERAIPYREGTRFTRTQLIPHALEDGTVIGVVGIIEDITPMKQAEIGLSRLAAIVRFSSDAIITKTLDGIITSWNLGAEQIFGYAAEEVLNKSIYLLIPPERQEEEILFLQKIADGENITNFDTVRVCKDGSRVFVSVSVSPLRDNDGTIIGISKIARDITERKRTEAEINELNGHLEQLVEARTQQLQAVNQELDSFAYVVSHDLKAPLRGITQLASWIAADYAERLDEEGRKMLQLLVGRSQRMHDMIEGILEYSRVGRVKDSQVRIDLNVLIAGIIDLLAPPASIEMIVSTNFPVIYADETRIRQVFQNLIGNAVKYMGKPSGRITISWSDQNLFWQFEVADTGPGIEPQYHDRIFQLFQTLVPRDEVESTGIGLAIVKKIVEMYGGRVWLTSEQEQGTIFYFTLPKMNEG